MRSQTKLAFLSVEDYLHGESTSPVRHEYLAGQIFAMVGATLAHNLIAMNLGSAMHTHLRGTPCRVMLNDMKVRVKSGGFEAFYYPDVVVNCEKKPHDTLYIEHPKLIVEVLSASTAPIDQREKKVAYQTLDSLQEYALVAQAGRRVDIYRRDSGNTWNITVYEQDGPVEFASIGLEMTMEDIYSGLD